MRRSTLTNTLVSGLPILLVGSWLIAFQSTTAAQQRLPDPRIFDELPPPSSSPIPSFNTPSSPPAFPDARPERELDFRAPNRPIPSRTPTSTLSLYRVDIFGDSPLLLSQVQRIEPDAFVRQDEGIIQAGVFADEFNAQSRVRELESQGFRARVTPITAGTGAVNPGKQISDRNTRERRLDQSYFVVIPGDARELPDIAAQVVQLGIRRGAVTQRESPRGPHVAVGPFGNRGDADRWSSYFRSVGMDARVYFGQ